MIKKEYSDDEKTCIENVFNYYIKKVLKDALKEHLYEEKKERRHMFYPHQKK